MNELKPKDTPVDPPKNEDNNILESQDKFNLQKDEQDIQKISSREMIDIEDKTQNDENNMADFMNTNGAEISHILRNPNDISQNMTNLDILGMPSQKTNKTPQESNKILDLENEEKPEIKDKFLDFGKEENSPVDPVKNDDFGLVQENKSEEKKDIIENKPDLIESENNNPILDTINEPGPPIQEQKPDQGGFDDIFDDVAFDNPETKPNETKKEEIPVKTESQVKIENNVSPKDNKALENKKSVEYSGDEQYYSPNYYQDTGGYEDEGESNYFQQNYYGGESDYDDDDKDYETYKRDDTVNENDKKENKKPSDPVDFL